MKTLKDQVDLTGELEIISMTELRARPGDCVTQASLGKCFAIARNDKVIAFLVPVALADVVHEILPDGSCKTLGVPPAPIEKRGCSVLGLDADSRESNARNEDTNGGS